MNPDDAAEKARADRKDAALLRENAAEAQAKVEARNSELRQANEHLVIATLAAKELTEAADLAHRRQDEFTI